MWRAAVFLHFFNLDGGFQMGSCELCYNVSHRCRFKESMLGMETE